MLVEPRPQRTVACNCKNSQCIKLYCECFRNDQFCNDCNCEGCLNKHDNPMRNATIAVIKQKNPGAFEPKFKPNKPQLFGETLTTKNLKKPIDLFLEVSRGCNCKHSSCRKKYCECFQYGLECSFKCKCVNCSNGNTHEIGEEKDRGLMLTIEESELRRLLVEKLTAIKTSRFQRQT